MKLEKIIKKQNYGLLKILKDNKIPKDVIKYTEHLLLSLEKLPVDQSLEKSLAIERFFTGNFKNGIGKKLIHDMRGEEIYNQADNIPESIKTYKNLLYMFVTAKNIDCLNSAITIIQHLWANKIIIDGQYIELVAQKVLEASTNNMQIYKTLIQEYSTGVKEEEKKKIYKTQEEHINLIFKLFDIKDYVKLQPVKVYVERAQLDIQLPFYAKEGDAGMDIRSTVDIVIAPGEQAIIPTGLSFAIPEGYEFQIRPRSGISAKTLLRIANSPGTIDSGYRGDLGIIVWNASTKNTGRYYIDEQNCSHGEYEIKKGDRIAQIVLNKIEKIEFEVVPKGKIKSIGTDRKSSFGESGLK